ncbi:MAG: hypothetical protein KDD37_06980 [Bdellovibrionales bacterium]|nr:hypothetical protein [Bdellovibrionales bacterium]
MIQAFLLSLIFASSNFDIPRSASPSCDLGNYIQPIIIIGETHFTESAKEVHDYVQTNLFEEGKIHFLLENSSLLGKRFIDQPILRMYLQVNDLVRALKEEGHRHIAIQWTNILYEFQKMPSLIKLNNMTEEEEHVVDFFSKIIPRLNKRSAKYIINEIDEFLLENPKASREYTIHLFSQMSLYAFTIYPFDENPIQIFDANTNLDEISFSDLKSGFIGLDEAREVFMAQKIFDYVCGILDRKKPVVIIVGAEHAESIKEKLLAANLNSEISVYDSFITYFLMRRLKSL